MTSPELFDVWSPAQNPCDCGSNFVGASKEWNKMIFAESQHIGWRLNPSNAPNSGHIFEADRTATKTHLTRVIRPRYSHTTNCIRYLWKSSTSSIQGLWILLFWSHWILRSILTILLKLNNLSHWYSVQRLYQDFWQTWHLLTLLQRSKWTDHHNPIELNTLVPPKDERVPPLEFR